MLESLKVSNVALIEEVSVDFAMGLNILSGETGAGKSIIIDSINFVMGGRMPRDLIRSGAETASVEVFITIANDNLIDEITNLGVEINEDRALLIFRSQNIKGKSVVRINGKPVTVGMLRDISELLIDIHGQHEHQSLLNSTKHMQLLDRFCQEDLDTRKSRLAEHISSYRALQKSITSLSGGDIEQEYRVEMYKFQLKEIEAANLTKDE